MKQNRTNSLIAKALIAIAGFSVINQLSANTTTISITDLIDNIESKSPVLNMMQTEIYANEKNIEAVKSKSGLKVKLQLSPSYADGEPTSFFAVNNVVDPAEPIISTEGEYLTGTISASYPLYKGGDLFGGDEASTNEAQAKLNLSHAGWQDRKVYITNLLANNYIEALRSIEQADVYGKIISRRKEQLELLTRKLKAKTATQSDVLSVKHALAKAKAGYSKSNYEYDTYLREMVDLAGAESTNNLKLVPLNNALPDLPSREVVVSYALEHRSEINAQRAKIDISNSHVEREEGGYYPEVNISLINTYASGEVDDDVRSFAALAVTASYEFGFGGYTSKAVAASKSMLLAQQQSLAIIKSAIKREALAAMNSLVNSNEDVKVAEAEVAKLEYDNRVLNEKYRKGFVSVNDVITNENDYLNAELKLIDSKYDRWVYYADLLKNIGQPFSLTIEASGR